MEKLTPEQKSELKYLRIVRKALEDKDVKKILEERIKSYLQYAIATDKEKRSKQ